MLKHSVIYSVLLFSLLVGTTNLYAQVHADFSSANVSGCSPITVKFNNLSTGATSWEWDLGNGTISNLENPSATYITAGTYNVKLTSKNGSNSSTITKTNFVTVFASPTVAFSLSATSGCLPLSVPFIDQSIAGNGSIVSWQWDFGDGNMSSEQNPVHIYSSVGIFNVVLTVKNSNGCIKTLTKQNLITVSSGGVNAFFTNSEVPICSLPAVVNFYDGSTGNNIINYLWDFGDGTTATDPFPMHVYNAAGIYDVSLKVSNAQGCNSTFKITNNVLVGQVKADFNMPATNCAGTEFALTNTSLSQNRIIKTHWNFGDGTSDSITNPKKIFTNPGVYKVTLAVDYGSCNNTISKTITVLPNAAPTFTVDVSTSCSPTLTAIFTNTTIGGTAINWDFGDGSSSTQPNPTHTFTSSGTYSVTLTSSNLNGCSGTTTIPSLVHLDPLKITSINGPFQGCVPYNANFTAVIEPAGKAVTYQWYFGDGSTSTQPTPAHVYANEGIYDVKLVVTAIDGGCSDTYTMNKAVTIGNKPSAAFVATPLIVCKGEPVYFTDSTSGAPNQYTWNFGDGSSSTDKNPVHGYIKEGYNTVTFIASKNGCADTSVRADYIFVNSGTATITDSFVCNKQYQHYFNSNSSDPNLVYNWDFGDGSTSTLPNPTHLYADTGLYKVTLTVNPNRCPISPYTAHVLNEHIGLTIVDSLGCGSTVKQFTALFNQRNVAKYTWDFGDGNYLSNSSLPYVSHAYSTMGNLTVKLEIVDINNCTYNVDRSIIAIKYAPKPNFSVVQSACANTVVTFTDKSVANVEKIEKWVWNFGDGSGYQIFYGGPFSHNYSKAGLYDVSLTVFDATGCSDSLIIKAAIKIGGPNALFNEANSTTCPNTPLQFYNASAASVIWCHWDFGDGETSTTVSPAHKYTVPGVYSVRLIVKDDVGCMDTLAKHAYLTVGDPQSIFSMSDSVSICPPLVNSFANKSILSSSYLWDFGDGNTSTNANPSHTYTLPGVFKVKLISTGIGGCSDSTIKQIKIAGPKGVLQYSPILGCTPLNVHFSNTSTNTAFYTWDFDDGFAVRNTNVVEGHSYPRLGTYLPKIILEDSAGCKVPIYGIDSITVKGVEPHVQALPNYLLCDSGIIAFKDSGTTNDAVKSYLWSFGDGQISTLANPVHKYATPGIYKVSYSIVSSLGCTGADTLKVPVKVVPSPNISFVAPASFCVPADVKLNGQWLNQDTSILSWKWDFGNGSTADAKNPANQTYKTPGNYTISCIATNGSGCADTIKHNLTVFPLPLVNAGSGKAICLGKSIALTASGALNYSWQTQPSLSCLQCSSPLATPTSSQKYIVSGTDLHGCMAEDSVSIKVQQPTVMIVGRGDTMCFGNSYRLNAIGAERYIWSPSSFLNSATISNPISTPDSSVRYRVIGYDTLGCFADTAFVSVKVYPIPKVNILEDKIKVSAGSTLQLHSNVSGDVTNVHWSPALGLSCINCNNPIASPKEDIVYTLSATNAGGCTAQDNVNMLVVCEQGNVYIPNTFSPNNDGVNDIFYPRGKGIYGIKGMRVFSKWGELIYEKTNFQPNDINSGWDGSFKGQKLTPDVYVYIIDAICINNQIFTLKGNVTLIR